MSTTQGQSPLTLDETSFEEERGRYRARSGGRAAFPASRSRRRGPAWVFSRPALAAPTWLAPAPPEPDPAGDAAPDAPEQPPPDAAEPDAGEPAAELVPWLRRALSGELEVNRTVNAATLHWSPLKPLESLESVASAVPTGGGVYIVLSSHGRPIYVGEADDFQKRWSGRLLGLKQVGFTSAAGRLTRPIRVHFGKLRGAANTRDARKAIEHVLIRTLLNGQFVSEPQLRNVMSVAKLRVVGRVHINALLPPALGKPRAAIEQLKGNDLKLGHDAVFEWSPGT